jgi:hypothetical protein
MRRVRLVMDRSIVGHVEFPSFSPAGHPDYQCIPEGVLSDPDAQAIAAALDRGEVVGRSGDCAWQAFLEIAAPVPTG